MNKKLNLIRKDLEELRPEFLDVDDDAELLLANLRYLRTLSLQVAYMANEVIIHLEEHQAHEEQSGNS